MPAVENLIDATIIERIASMAPKKTILVVGDVMLDEYITGEVKRISPEAPVPVVQFHSRYFVPGGAANVAANVASLGCRALLAGVVGADSEAKQLEDALEKAGVPADRLICDRERPTTVKFRVLAQSQHVVRIDRESRTLIAVDLENALVTSIERSVPSVDVCILSDYGKGVVTPRVARDTIALCRDARVPVLIDPKSLDARMCRGAALVKPNHHEARRLASCQPSDEMDFLDLGRRIAELIPGTAILITRGALGMSLFRADHAPMHVPTVARNVYDVTGAGDTAIGSLAAALAAGVLLEHAVVFANQCAAIAVGKLGTTAITFDEITLPRGRAS